MKSEKTQSGAGSTSPATAGSAGPLTGPLTDDDINLIDKCLAQCSDNLRGGAGFANVVQMACIYTTERIAAVREKLKPNNLTA